jgi:hypothetical protein
MIVIDRVLVGGIKFVLGKIADAVDAELSDEGRLKEQLLAAQMQRELGEISEEELAAVEGELLARLREARVAQGGDEALSPLDDGVKVVGVEAQIRGER